VTRKAPRPRSRLPLLIQCTSTAPPPGQGGDLKSAAAAPELRVAALKLRRDEQDADHIKADGAWVDTGLVFTARHGTRWNRETSAAASTAASVKARVPRITVHGTRKTCGSLLAALDVHPRVAMQILGHSKIAITMEIYAI
jgi:integrase